jgi:hypothetical protein
MDDDLDLSIAVIACAIAAGVLLFSDGRPGVDDLKANKRELAQALQLYPLYKREGSPILACVQARRVAELFAWTGDPANAQAWQSRHDADCANVVAR